MESHALREQLLRFAEAFVYDAENARPLPLAASALGLRPEQVLVPALLPEHLGDVSFREDYGLSHAYVAGSMANGIASTALVEAISGAGMLGFFGAAGLSPDRVETAIATLKNSPRVKAYGFNLIHSPSDAALEDTLVSLYLRHHIHLLEASAFMGLTLPLVRYRTFGIAQAADGRINTPNRLMAKVSRHEVAEKFFAPPPIAMLRELVQQGHLSEVQARLAEHVPMAQDVTAEADSGGHTDNRPSFCLFSTLAQTRDSMQARYGKTVKLRLGLAGGIGCPASAAAAFALGAAYIMTGSINQCSREAGTSDVVRQMLAQAQSTDVTMAPAADMFEMGIKVQVLRRGTLFAMRAGKLYEIYKQTGSIGDLSANDLELLERQYFRQSLDQVWRDTKAYFASRDPQTIGKAEHDGKHKLALLLRSYLGQASRWANAGEPTRQMDYQVWCGPAMGAFNTWVKGSPLAPWENRTVAVIAHNLMAGAALHTRANYLRLAGVELDEQSLRWQPTLEINNV